MSGDRELLELAARAAGLSIRESRFVPGKMVVEQEPDSWVGWNPLRDDGDALRLAVKLDMDIELRHDTASANSVLVSECQSFSWHQGDKYTATRRAIVKTAAELGKLLPDLPTSTQEAS